MDVLVSKPQFNPDVLRPGTPIRVYNKFLPQTGQKVWDGIVTHVDPLLLCLVTHVPGVKNCVDAVRIEIDEVAKERDPVKIKVLGVVSDARTN